MRTASIWATDPDARAAAASAHDRLVARLGGPPTDLVARASISHPPGEVAAVLRERAGGAPVHGGTSCLGVMTEAGLHFSVLAFVA